eukprot:evm.model.scf_9.11 EVM.evm.TU.scf_9.11   scf_9:175515-177886(-)
MASVAVAPGADAARGEDNPNAHRGLGGRGPRRRCRGVPAVSSASTRVEQSRDLSIGDAGQLLKGGLSKRVVAKTDVGAPPQQVWRVLTNYRALPRVVPDLVASEVLPGGRKGRTLLRQKARNGGDFWGVEAEGVLEMEEVELASGALEIRFRMVEPRGAFAQYYGRWCVDSNGESGHTSVLRFDAVVSLRVDLPDALFDFAVRSWLPRNIEGLRDRAEKQEAVKVRPPNFAAGALEDDVVIKVEGPREARGRGVDVRVQDEAAGVAGCGEGEFGKQRMKSEEQKKLPLVGEGGKWKRGVRRRRVGRTAVQGMPVEYLGTNSVPLPPMVPSAASSSDDGEWGEEGEGFPTFEAVPRGPSRSEVHLRKLDTLSCLHRRVVAMIAVNAPRQELWQVVTDYNNLADILPNLAESEVMGYPKGAPAGYCRVRQVAVKSYPDMEMSVESVLDMVEKPMAEIQFRQREGMFDVLQGKWIISEGEKRGAEPVVLKYAMEVKMGIDAGRVKVVEPLLERFAVEDIQHNLEAIKNHVEGQMMGRQVAELREAGDDRRADALERQSRQPRPKMANMAGNFEVLAEELGRCYGERLGGYLPTRADLRRDNRTDIEKAITAHGGPAGVAERMGWQLQTKRRKPRGYWDDADNILQEIDDFIIENDLPKGVMPRKIDFVRAERHDLRRAVERWGGVSELANSLGLEVAPQVGGKGPEVGDNGFDADSAGPSSADSPEGSIGDLLGMEIASLPKAAANGSQKGKQNGTGSGNGRRQKMRMNVRELDLVDG